MKRYLEAIKNIEDLDVSKILTKYENSLIENTEILALLNTLIALSLKLTEDVKL